MITEPVRVADIALQRVDASVPRNVHHLEYRGSARGRRSQKTGSQAMSADRFGIEPNALSVGLDDVGHALGGQQVTGRAPTLYD